MKNKNYYKMQKMIHNVNMLNFMKNINFLSLRHFYFSKYTRWKYTLPITVQSYSTCGESCTCFEKTNIHSSENKVKEVICSKHLASLLGCSHLIAIKFVVDYPKILTFNPTDIKRTVFILEKYFDVFDIIQNPRIFHMKHSQIEECLKILKEIGIRKITMNNIIKFPKLIEKSLKQLAEDKMIISNKDIIKNMSMELKDYKNNLVENLSSETINKKSINYIRTAVLEEYLSWRLNYCWKEIRNMLISNSILMISCNCLKKTLDILIDEYHISKNEIFSNSFLIGISPTNLENLLKEVPTLAGMDIKECVKKFPRILCFESTKILEIDRWFKENNYSDKQSEMALELFCQRIKTMQDYFKTIDSELLENISVDMLLKPGDDFDEYFSKYLEVIKCKKYTQVYCYLAKLLNKTEFQIYKKLNENSDIMWISLQHVIEVTNFLLENGISKEQLWYGLHIICYTLDNIEKHFKKLSYHKELQPFSEWKNHYNLLHLLLYYINKESGSTIENIYINNTKNSMLKHFTEIDSLE